MPVSLNAIGIQALNITLAETVDVGKKLERKTIKDKDGNFAHGQAFDPMFDISIKGRGDIDAALAVGTNGGNIAIVGISGGVTLITNVKETFNHDDFNSWDVTAQNAPGAS